MTTKVKLLNFKFCLTKSNNTIFINLFQYFTKASTMKLFFVFLNFLFVVFCSGEQINCDSWPTNLKPIRDCCKVPNYVDENFESKCLTKCAGKGEECLLKCYIDKTKIVANGTINKAAVKKTYESLMSNDNRFWLFAITQALDKCQYDSTGMLTQNILKFYDCINDYLGNNCKDFVSSQECEAVFEHIEQCKIECSSKNAWDECCRDPPPLFLHEIFDKCSPKPPTCTSEFPESIEKKCVEDEETKCILQIVHSKLEGKPEKITDFLVTNSNNSVKWREPIKKVANVCGSKMKGLSFYNCLLKIYYYNLLFQERS